VRASGIPTGTPCFRPVCPIAGWGVARVFDIPGVECPEKWGGGLQRRTGRHDPGWRSQRYRPLALFRSLSSTSVLY